MSVMGIRQCPDCLRLQQTYWDSMMQNVPCILMCAVDIGKSTSRAPVCGQQEVTGQVSLTSQRIPCLCFVSLVTELVATTVHPFSPLCTAD
jgi:hypothetical protein